MSRPTRLGSSRLHSSPSLLLPLLAGLTVPASLLVGCSGGGDITDPPAQVGSLQITTSTTGPSPDPDGYTVLLEGIGQGTIGVTGTDTLAGLSPGSHQVGLSGVATNCTVAGDNPRAVTIMAGVQATVTFAVTCTPPPPTTGTIRVTMATSGTDLDPNGYVLTLDGGAEQPIAPAGMVTLTNVSAGDHALTLGDVATNCTLNGNNPREVTVVAGDTAAVAFAVSCSAITGGLLVTTTTTGTELDADGYRVRLDDGPGQVIGIIDTLILPGLTPGPHDVRLVQVADNCTVVGENPKTVDVTPGATVSVSFAVTCGPTTGTIAARVSSSGDPLDPDGYVLTLDGAMPRNVAPNDTASFLGVTPGPHTVALTNVSETCSVADGASRPVAVTPGDTTAVAFEVTCAPPPFGIELLFLTTPTTAQRQIFEAAKSRWQGLIVGDLPNVQLLASAGDCGNNSPALNRSVDDVLILVTLAPIDGAGGILGQAGPCFIRSTSGLPALGLMRFDTADLDMLQSEGLLGPTILHEMGHVLGYGTLWPLFALLADASLPPTNGTDPHFTGTQAIAAFNAVGGSSYSGAKVPVETTGGVGTADSHWRESVFGNEVMTGFIGIGANPLSRVSVASMGDMGYTVNQNGADPYTLAPGLRAYARGKTLRLHNDLVRVPVRVVNERGQVERIIQP